MESRNPVLNRMEQEAKANGGYAGFGAATATQAPPVGADTPPAMPIEMTPAGPTMTLNDVIVRTATMFVPLLITAYFAWTLEVGFGIVLIAMFVALGLGFWGALSKKVRPAVFLAYATVEGIVLGGISLYLQDYVNQSQWAAGQANP
ncbi:MAG: Bax inhibitor-1/YccA family protein, partial [Actinomycetes bacterium]